jgi:23S rRNA (pseudouridine1915-N3)-methyltransferase
VKLALFVVGRRDRALAAAEDDYAKRLRAYCTFALREHDDERALLAALPAGAHLYAFDERGDAIASADFAQLIAHEQMHGGGAPVVFAIGGADGHGDALRARALRAIAFGRMTIAHRLVRVVALEQLYRAFTIVRGEPYHRG